MTKKRNSRSLDDIAGEIHKLERASIFETGELLIEAKNQCDYGSWLDWVEREFDWSPDTAERYMGAAELAGRFRTVRNLPVPVTTIYAHASLEGAAIPDAIARLVAATKKGRITAERGRQIVELAGLRHDHGDLPDETLLAIERVESDSVQYHDERIVAALKEAKPATEAEADAVVAKFQRADDAAVEKDSDGGEDNDEDDKETEAEALLAGC